MTKLQKQSEQYHAVIEEIKDTIIECKKKALEAILEMKWHIGDVILRFRAEEQIKNIVRDTGINEMEIGRCLNFRNQWQGKDYLDAVEKKPLPEGDNTSWRKMVNVYLPQTTRKIEPCKHEELITITICKKCGKRMD